VWLLGLYHDALKNIINYSKKDKEKYEKQMNKFKENVSKIYTKSLYNEGVVGSISELYDTDKPQLPKGAIAQAWSVSEIIKIVMG
jgi:glycogen debranching enzyme